MSYDTAWDKSNWIYIYNSISLFLIIFNIPIWNIENLFLAVLPSSCSHHSFLLIIIIIIIYSTFVSPLLLQQCKSPLLD